MIYTHVCNVAVCPDLLLVGCVASYAWITYSHRFFVQSRIPNWPVETSESERKMLYTTSQAKLEEGNE